MWARAAPLFTVGKLSRIAVDPQPIAMSVIRASVAMTMRRCIVSPFAEFFFKVLVSSKETEALSEMFQTSLLPCQLP